MPSIQIAVPLFPNVPQLPGVPQLARSPTVPATSPPPLGSQAMGALFAAGQAAPVWGIFNASNVRVVDADSVLDFDNRNEWRVSDYPVQSNTNGEGTGFAPYNKVTLPFENSVRLSKGGTLTDRTNFLSQIAAIAGDTNLYTIRSPERSYVNVNVLRYEVTRRGPGGAYFLYEVDIYFRQVPLVQALYSSTSANTANAQNPAAVPPANLGTVQPATPSVQTQALAASKLSGGASSSFANGATGSF